MKNIHYCVLIALVAGCGSEKPTGQVHVAGQVPAATVNAQVPTTTIAAVRQAAYQAPTPLTVLAVVIAVDRNSPDATLWYVQDPEGGPYSGVAVWCAPWDNCPATVKAPKLHDYVLISGTITASAIHPTMQQVIPGGPPAPAPTTVSALDLASRLGSARTWGLWGSKVRLPVVTTVDSLTPWMLANGDCMSPSGDNLCKGPICAPSYYGFEVIDGAGNKIIIGNDFQDVTGLVSSPECKASVGQTQVITGGTFDFIEGILDQGTAAEQVLMPTSPDDFVFHP
jgi:hypothetical protein